MFSATVLNSVKFFTFEVIPIPRTLEAEEVRGVILGTIFLGKMLFKDVNLSDIACLLT